MHLIDAGFCAARADWWEAIALGSSGLGAGNRARLPFNAVLIHSKAQAESVADPDAMADDLCWKTMALVESGSASTGSHSDMTSCSELLDNVPGGYGPVWHWTLRL